jgi:hypothetical protein
MQKLDEILATVEQFRGARFQLRARSFAIVDCLGLVTMTGKLCGISDWDCVDYPNYPDPTVVLGWLRQNFVPSDKRNLASGDIVAFKAGVYPMHLGLIDCERQPGQPWVTHVAEPRGGFFQQPLDFMPRFAFRFPGMT